MHKPLEILLVEDSPADIRLTEEALKDTDLEYKLSVVNDGEEAMTFLKEKESSASPAPDVILLDLNMPRKTGHDVLAEIKEDPAMDEIPIVVLTVSQDEEDVLKALNLRMNYYLNKPVTAGRLGALLKSIEALWN